MATGTWQAYGMAVLAVANGSLNLGTGTYKVMLAGAAYTPDVDGHDFRNDVSPETTGTNWAAGGQTVTVTFSKIDASNRVAVIITDVSVATVTLTDGKHAVLYKAVGSSATDNLIAYCTFDVALAPTAGTLTIDSDNTNGAFYFTY